MAKHVMTPEAARKLSGILPFDSSAVDKFTPKIYEETTIPDEKGEEVPLAVELRPVFHLRPLSKAVKETLKTKYVGKVGDASDMTKQMLTEVSEAVRKHIVTFENLYDTGLDDYVEPTTETIDGKQCIDVASYDKIPEHCVASILLRLLQISGLVDKELLGLRF